ncbi:MAG: hypothetical protein LBV60_17480, partial [Streptomyces sp.]|nr:hypothetical protein [Streptomyces sp.]
MTPETATDLASATRQPPASRSAAAPRRRVPWRAVGTLAILAGAAFVAQYHWPVIAAGADRLAGADRG